MIFAKDTICTGESMSGESKDPEDQWQQGARHLGPPAGRVDVATGWKVLRIGD